MDVVVMRNGLALLALWAMYPRVTDRVLVGLQGGF
jgi:hypothetical protein